jgi:hypothetical protein
LGFVDFDPLELLLCEWLFDPPAFSNWAAYIEVLDFFTNIFPTVDLFLGLVLLPLLRFDVVAVLVAGARAHQAGRFGISLICFAVRGGLSA